MFAKKNTVTWKFTDLH